MLGNVSCLHALMGDDSVGYFVALVGLYSKNGLSLTAAVLFALVVDFHMWLLVGRSVSDRLSAVSSEMLLFAVWPWLLLYWPLSAGLQCVSCNCQDTP